MPGLISTYSGYRRRVEACDYPPTRIWVEPTSDCNLRCSFCGNRKLSDSERGYMDLAVFRSITDEVTGRVGQFNLFHRGESLLHPDLPEMVRYAAQKEIRTRIHTNGTLLRGELSRKLVEAGLDVISFSIDGYDREMYEANRPNARFDAVTANLTTLLQLKRDMRSSKPFVAVETMELGGIPSDDLARRREAFRTRFQGLPLDKYVIRRPHNWAGLVDTQAMGAPAPRSPKVIPCPLLWHALVVLWDGTVLPCPQDFFGRLRLGDIRDGGVLGVWNGDAIREMRREMADPSSQKRSPCASCDRIVRSTIAGIPTDYLGRFLGESLFRNGWISRLLPH